MASTTTRTCSNCAKLLPVGEFMPLRGTTLTATCITCRRVSAKTKSTAQKRGAVELLLPTQAQVVKRRRLESLDTDKENINPNVNLSTTVVPISPLSRSPPRRRLPLTPKHTYRGIVESDSPAHAAARKEQIAIRREHRVQRRNGEDVPATPTLTQLAERYRPSPILDSQSSYNPTRNSTPTPSPWIAGRRRRVTRRVQRRHIPQQQLDQGQLEAARSEGADLLQQDPLHKDPTIDPANLNLHDQALPPSDAKYIENFRRNLARDQFEECSRCQRRWFNMKVVNGICGNCRKVDRHKMSNEPYLFGDENLADPGPFPQPPEGSLPELTQFEEMLIARVHTFMEVRQHRGQQYKYSGHICNFLCNTGRIYDELPLLPRELNVLVLRPAHSRDDPHMQRQFKKNYTVRRWAVQRWLLHLQRHHPGYRDIRIRDEALAALPEGLDGACIVDDLITRDDEEDGIRFHDAAQDNATRNGDGIAPTDATSEEFVDDEDGPDPDVTAIPDISAEQQDIDVMREQFRDTRPAQPPQHAAIAMPSFRNTPIDEFNKSQQCLSLAFPTLFPNGKGEFCVNRVRAIDYAEFVKHLLLYKDGRFARHPRFRYVAFNTIMRKQVNARASFFVNKVHSGANEVTVEELRRAFEEDTAEAQSLMKQIIRYSANVRGTRSYWYGRRKALESQVKQLDCPHLFVTLSAADYHWEPLMSILPHYQEWKDAGTTRKRMKIARESVRDNPLIVAYHFERRYEAFFKEVLKPKFHITDYWNRYEWQGRGSTHSHGLYWIDDKIQNVPRPNLPNIKVPENRRSAEDQALYDYFAKFWGLHISAVNPQPGLHRQQDLDDRSPLSLPGDLQRNDVGFLSSVVNWVQVHTCSRQYCLRKVKGKDEEVCRFGAPWNLLEEPNVSVRDGQSFPRFNPVRNDPRLNAYSRLISMGWLANTDIQPCTCKEAVIFYLGKYATKPEKQSESIKAIFKSLTPCINEQRPVYSLMSKVLNKLIGERDWSSQEVCHHLLNLNLVNSSRIVQNVNCRPENEQGTFYSFEDGSDGDVQIAARKSVLQKYCDRPEGMVDESGREITYMQFLKLYDFRTYKKRPQAFPRVLNFFPEYDQTQQEEHYARVKLMLHHPFRHMEDLKIVDGLRYDTFSQAYMTCYSQHSHEEDHYGTDIPQEVDDDLESIGSQDNDDIADAPFAELAQRLPGHAGERVDPDALGDRPIDREADWTSKVGVYPELRKDEYWKLTKDQNPTNVNAESSATYEGLQEKQKLFFDLVMNHYRKILAGENPPQLLLHLDGQGGTGKSHVIMYLSQELDRICREANEDPDAIAIVRAAPSGVAAFNISGKTIHSLFRFNPKAKKFEKLSEKSTLQAAFRSVKYILIDEKSMLGVKQLAWISMRLKEIFPNNSTEPFGGCNVILCGDFYQLPPVGAKPLYARNVKDMVEVYGQQLYRKFNRTIVLDVVMRQRGPEEEGFRETLERLRVGKCTIEDWKRLSTRLQPTLSSAEVESFNDALRIYATRLEVYEHNWKCLRDMGIPVLNVPASHDRQNAALAAKASTEEAGNLEKNFTVGIGCQVMLTENVWTERGLVNGAMGTVYDIVWETGVEDPRKTPPLAILVHFPKYSGPSFTEIDGKPVVPIFRQTAEWSKCGTVLRRTQFPLVLAYAITIHKSQGLTVEKAVLNISNKAEFAPGLTYVAVSRVKSLNGLMFEECFDLQRLQKKDGTTVAARRMDECLRLTQQNDFNLLHSSSQPDQNPYSHLNARTADTSTANLDNSAHDNQIDEDEDRTGEDEDQTDEDQDQTDED